MDIKAIVFDLDGTIIDSTSCIIDSLFYALNYMKVKPSIAKKDFHVLMGKSLNETLDILIPNYDDYVKEKVKELYVSNYFSDHMNVRKTFPDVYGTLEKLFNKGFKLSIFTAKSTYCAKKEIKASKLDRFFEIIQGTENHIPPKPNPEGLIGICKDIKLDTRNVLMVGDTDRDIIAGTSAGCKTCAVTYNHWDEEKFISNGIKPNFFINKFKDILPIVLQ